MNSESAPSLPSNLEDLLADYLRAVSAPKGARAAAEPPGMPSPEEAVQAMLRLSGALPYSFPTGGVAPLSQSEEGRRLLELPPTDKARVALAAYARWSLETGWKSPLERVITELFRSKLDLDLEQALDLVASSHRLAEGSYRHERIASVMGTLKRFVETQGLVPVLKAGIVDVRDTLHRRHADSHLAGRKIVKSLNEILALEKANADGPTFEPMADVWAPRLKAKLAALPAQERAQLMQLLHLAAKGGGNAKPSKSWLKQAVLALESVQPEVMGALLLDVVALYDSDRRHARTRADLYLSLENQSVLRGLLWLAAMASPKVTGRRLEELARTYLTWVGTDYNSLVLGNAAIHAFSLMRGSEGVAGLMRLRRQLKRPGEAKAIEKALAAIAADSGTTAEDLEELGLPDFGFDADGKRTIELGPKVVGLSITPLSKLVSVKPDGELDQSADADLKALSAEVADTLEAVRLRLERLYLTDRTLPLSLWRERYLEHPLVSAFAQQLIWSFESAGESYTAIPSLSGLHDVAGEPLPLENDSVRVKLWHPMHSEPGEVLAWRRRLIDLNRTQPFKQAHREIYVLTDAERETAFYSNRFAGQILAQKIFRALTRGRGWKAPLQGKWDSGSQDPISKELPAHGLRFEFSIEPIEASANERWQYDFLSTNAVRFTRALGIVTRQHSIGNFTFERRGPAFDRVRLDEVSPVVFSEMMRDVDLFVGVAGIGNDPLWADRHGHQFADYWQEAASSALMESGKARRSVLGELLPSLSIASRCHLEDRHLVVQGNLRTYRIHLGSANIQMEPTGQFLCIVPDKARLGSDVYLPFEGDGTLSVILSKAFMLAADDRIKDRSIRSQIDRAG